MDEQHDNATTHLEAQQAKDPQSTNSPRFHIKRTYDSVTPCLTI